MWFRSVECGCREGDVVARSVEGQRLDRGESPCFLGQDLRSGDGHRGGGGQRLPRNPIPGLGRPSGLGETEVKGHGEYYMPARVRACVHFRPIHHSNH